MITDEIYNRSMGYRFDPDRLHEQLANGTAGYDDEFDRDNGMTLDASDLYIESSSADENTYRLQEIEFELATLLNNDVISNETAQELVLLEAEKIIRLGKWTEGLMAEDPESATVLRDLFATQLMERAEAGQPVDAEMFVELDKLAYEIAAQNSHLDTEGFIELYESMEALIKAQLVLDTYVTASEDTQTTTLAVV